MTNATLNKNFVIQTQETREQFPALQSSNYKPSVKEVLTWVLSPESVELLTEDAKALLSLSPTTCIYGGGEKEVNMFSMTEKAKFVILSRPQLFKYNKNTKVVSPLSKFQDGDISYSKVFLGLVVDGVVITNDAGEPQIFTVKLDSYKTDIIGSWQNKTQMNGDRTMFLLNEALVKHYQLPRGSWVTHLVGVSLQIVPEKRTGRNSQSSMSIRFRIDGNATPLSDENQQLLFTFVSSQYFQDLAKNPFGDLTKVSVIAQTETETVETTETEINDDIPF